jgi:hypothetical protein
MLSSRYREHGSYHERLMGLALDDALASKLRELLKGVSWLRDWQVEKAAVPTGNGFDLGVCRRLSPTDS